MGGATLPVELDLLLGSLAEVEGIADEGYTGLPAAAGAGNRLISRYRDPAYLASRTAKRLARPGYYADYPRQIHAILEELKDGEVEVQFNHQGLDQLISKVDILANRLVFALLISALILGSSLLGVFGQTGLKILGVNIFGFLGFVLAALLGLALLVGIIRSGRL
jgi:ubiquinone biosynthesis protein